MKRVLLNLLTLLSLLLCVAVCALWVRSYFIADTFYLRDWRGTRGYEWLINSGSSNGGLFLLRSLSSWQPAAGDPDSRESGGMHDRPTGYPGDAFRTAGTVAFAGFRYLNETWNQQLTPSARPRAIRQTRTLLMVVPCWFAALLFGVLPTIRLYRRLRRKRRDGVCRSCGYDLTGNVSGACPECGSTAIAPA